MAATKDKVITIESLKAKHDYDEATYLKKSGDTMTGTLVLTNNTDAAPTSYTAPALVVGGATTAAHLEIDTNEILAKSSATTAGNLFLNDDVGSDIKVGISGSVDIYNTGITPRAETNAGTGVTTLKTIDIGATDKPFNQVYGKNYNLYNKYDNTNTDYGALRIGTTTETVDDQEVKRPTAILELGNSTAMANSGIDTDSRLTMYGKGASFTNVFPNPDRTSGSNKVYLPVQDGTLALSKAGSYQGYNSTGIETNPMTLRLGFEANILFVWHPNETGYPYGIFFRGSNGIYHGGDGTTKVIKTTWDGNNVSWYTEESNALYGLSGAGKSYSYMAF